MKKPKIMIHINLDISKDLLIKLVNTVYIKKKMGEWYPEGDPCDALISLVLDETKKEKFEEKE